MIILVACEFSGIVRDAFIARGHDAISCDLRPCERAERNAKGVKIHYQGDVFDLLKYNSWDLMIAHPPCTYLTNAGARWLYKGGKGTERDPERWAAMEDAAQFFLSLLNAPIARVAIENPIMHSYARELIQVPKSQTIQPYQHGHAETKATCLWLRNLPPLEVSNFIAPDYKKWPRRQQINRATGEVVQQRGSGYATNVIGGGGGGYEPRVHRMSPGKKGSDEREKNRSRTMEGIASAMAEQWGIL